MQPRRQHRRGLIGVLIGTATTVLIATMYADGNLDRFARMDLDYGFRHFNVVEPDPRIAMIDINDFALQKIHSWPWPRRMQADLIRVLHECGAQAIVLDIVYSEPTPASLDDPRLAPGHELETGGEVIGELSLDAAVYHDDELARAMADAGNVYAAMYFELMLPHRGLHALRDELRRRIDANPALTTDELLAGMSLKDRLRRQRLNTHARMDHLLRQDFALDAATLARRLDFPLEHASVALDDVKEAAGRWLVGRALTAKPDATFADVYAEILPGAPPEVETPDRAELKRAYAYVLSARKVFAAPAVAGDLAAVISAAGDETLPIPGVAAAAKRIGSVSFNKDSDGVLRHVPPLMSVAGCTVPQLGFALACDVLGFVRAEIKRVDPPRLAFYDSANHIGREIPLTASGEMLLNWHIDRDNPTWEHSFGEHIPVAQVLEVALNRRAVAENVARMRVHRADAASLMFEGADAAYLDYERDVRRLRELEQGGTPASADEMAAVQRRVSEVDEKAAAHIERLHAEVSKLQPESDEERTLFARVIRVHDAIGGEYVAQVEQRNRKLLADAAERVEALKKKLQGKFCLVGYTASAVADMVNSPVYGNMPGVMAHANMLNTVLSGRFPRVASVPTQTALILIGGLLTALVAATRGPWQALIAMLVIALAMVSASAGAFHYWQIHFGSLIPVGTAFATWAIVTLFRQMTELRQRRSLARALARNTSPAIAARITEQLDDFEVPPQPAQVTCYFSDLEGFTTLCEELGVERTQTILNTYLAAMGEVLVGFRGFNKFMGDGIFAFLNAPLWPIEEHAVAGCEAALVTQGRLTKLKSDADEATAAAFRDIRMRVGLHTGPVFVGNFGSEYQSDYTCIGDTVNLAARLESANKAFGTQIMVSGACRDAVGDRYVFRDLGALQVKGKLSATPVFELLGRKGEVPADQISYAAQFAAGVTEFARAQWPAARAVFQRCAVDFPNDRAVDLYLAEIERFETHPDLAGSVPALQLTSK